jgi:hypothetical protein
MTTATAYTFDDNIVSDLHKDAYGFRPGQSFSEYWNASDDDRKQRIWDDLLDALRREMEYQRQREAEAVHDFNVHLRSLLDAGAKDFEMALRWMHDAHDTNGDDEYLEYKLGLPYGHIAKARKA